MIFIVESFITYVKHSINFILSWSYWVHIRWFLQWVLRYITSLKRRWSYTLSLGASSNEESLSSVTALYEWIIRRAISCVIHLSFVSGEDSGWLVEIWWGRVILFKFQSSTEGTIIVLTSKLVSSCITLQVLLRGRLHHLIIFTINS